MMRIWSYRPQFLHLGLFIAAYILGCGFAQSLAIVPGTGISVWPPGGLFLATLVLAPRHSWPWWVLAGCLAELFSNVLWFHSPLPAAFLIYAGNALEAVVGAWLVNRTLGRPVQLETLQQVLAFVVLGAGIAPVVSATVGSATLAWFGIQSQSFSTAWALWWIGDATGVLIVAPLALVVFQNWRGKAWLSVSQWIEACLLGLIFLGIAALSLSGYLPFAYIIMPPLLWAAVRFEFKGAVVTLALLALITAVFTTSGASQFIGDPESQRQKQIMLQLFLAISAFSALIVAAISRQHQVAVLTLRQSVSALRGREQELSQLVDMVPSHVWRLTSEGEPTFFNKRMVDFLGFDVGDMAKPATSRLEALSESVHPEDAAEFRGVLDRCLVTGETFVMRYRLRRADGCFRWMSIRAEPLRDQDGRIVQWYGLCHDVDDQVHAEEALQRSERQLQQLTDAVPALIWATTPEGMPVYVNKRFRDVIGASLEDITAPDGSLYLSVIHVDDRDAALQSFSRSLGTGVPYVQRYRQLRSDGSYRWTETRAEPLRDETGTILQWYGVSVDIHDLVIAQEALQKSERRYRDLFQYMPIGLAQVDASKLVPLFNELRAQGVKDLQTYIDEHPEFLPRAVEALEVEEANEHVLEMFGARNAKEMGGPITRYWQPGIATIRRSIEARYRGEELFQEETKVARMDGSVIDVLFTTARRGAAAEKSLVGFIDITERKKAEEALRESEQQLEQMIDAVPINILSFAPSGRMTYASKRYLDDVGLPTADIEDFDALARDLAHPEDFPTMFRRASNGFATGQPFVNRFRRRNKHGVYRWIEARAQPLRDADGAIVQWYIASIDIEDEMHAQEALRERERFLWQLVETLPAMIDCAAPSGEPVYRSQQLREFLGYELEELDGAGKSRLDGTLEAGVHPDDLAGLKEQYARCLSTGEPYARRHRLRRFDGEYRWVETRAAPMRNDEGTIVQWNVICLDIDSEVRIQEELRLAQERLSRASQAASLAELSASIAHEVNQPLAAIIANSHACYRWLSAEPVNVTRAKITTERIIRDANSAADVVSRIRALFKQSAENRSSFALSTAIMEACSLLADEAMRRRVRIDVDMESELPPVTVDRIQVQQVLINLIRNGMEAMDFVAGDKVLGVRVHRVGREIQTEISDQGRGIEFPDRVFEPFFTTKERGMGMGLAICRSIVESHGGRLWTENNEPHGARFIFTLPVTTKAVP